MLQFFISSIVSAGLSNSAWRRLGIDWTVGCQPKRFTSPPKSPEIQEIWSPKWLGSGNEKESVSGVAYYHPGGNLSSAEMYCVDNWQLHESVCNYLKIQGEKRLRHYIKVSMKGFQFCWIFWNRAFPRMSSGCGPWTGPLAGAIPEQSLNLDRGRLFCWAVIRSMSVLPTRQDPSRPNYQGVHWMVHSVPLVNVSGTIEIRSKWPMGVIQVVGCGVIDHEFGSLDPLGLRSWEYLNLEGGK